MVNMASLSEIATINPRMPKELRADNNRRVSFLPMAAIREDGQLEEVETRVLSEVVKGYTYYERGDVLFAKITPCFENGKAAYLESLPFDVGFGSTEFHVLRPNDRVDGRYLFHMVWNPTFRFLAAKAMTGAAGQKRVPTPFVKDFKIPLPSLVEQKRIAVILDKADAIRRKRLEAISLADIFLRSVFLKMFGDPVTNPMGWDVKKLEQVADVSRGKFTPRPRNDPRYYGGNIPFIQTGDVVQSNTYVISHKQTLNEEGLKVSKKFQKGTIAITIAANIGETAILSYPMCFPDSVVGIVPREMPPEFLEHQLRAFKPFLNQRATKTAQKNINLQNLRPLEVICPPIDRQKCFFKHVECVFKRQSKLQEQFCIADNLFSSLQQRAFRGDL